MNIDPIIDEHVRHLIASKAPGVTEPEIEYIDSMRPESLSAIKAAVIEPITFLGTVKDCLVFLYNGFRILVISLGVYTTASFVVQLVTGREMPQPSDVALAIRQRTAEMLANPFPSSAMQPSPVGTCRLPEGLQLNAGPELTPDQPADPQHGATPFESFALGTGNGPDPDQSPVAIDTQASGSTQSTTTSTTTPAPDQSPKV